MTRWHPIASAPMNRRVLLHLADGSIVFGSYRAEQFSPAPRPYWSNDLEHLRGKLWARANQPTHWAEIPPRPSTEGAAP